MSESKSTDDNVVSCIICQDESTVDNPLHKMKCCQAHYHLKCFNEDIARMRNQNKFECSYCRQKLTPPTKYSLKKRDENMTKLQILKHLFLKINSIIFIIFTLYSNIESSIKLLQKTTTVWSILLVVFFTCNFSKDIYSVYTKYILKINITNVDNAVFLDKIAYFPVLIANIDIVCYIATNNFENVDWEYNFLISPLILSFAGILVVLAILLFPTLYAISKVIFCTRFIVRDIFQTISIRGCKCFRNYWTHSIEKNWEENLETNIPPNNSAGMEDNNLSVIIDVEKEDVYNTLPSS